MLIWQAQSWRIRGDLRAAEDRIEEARAAAAAITDKWDIKRGFQAQIAVEAGHGLRARARPAQALQKVIEARAILNAAGDARNAPDCGAPAAAATELEILVGMDARDAGAAEQARRFESTLKPRPLDVLDHAACLSWRLETLSASASRAGLRDLAQLLDNGRSDLSRHWRARLPADAPLPWQLERAPNSN